MKKNLPIRSITLRNFGALAAVFAVLGIASPSLAQTPELEAYYDRLEPKDSFKYKINGKEKTCNIGAFHWFVPPTDFSTGGLDRNFTGYCSEVDVPIVEKKLYRFQQRSILDPKLYNQPATPEGAQVAERRSTLIRELYGRYYAQNSSFNPNNTYALQLALWELTSEAEPVDRAATFDLFSGTFQADYPKDQAPAFVTLAQTYLDSLTGNDAIYYENPELSGRELIWLQGTANAEGTVAQSQYALRYMNGGAPGVGPFANTLGNGGGGGIGGYGGAGLGGGNGAGLGTGEGEGGGAPLLSTGGTPTSTTTTGNNSGPPTGTGSRVPAGGPSTAVPAPAGFILGIVALGALASRRVYARLVQK